MERDESKFVIKYSSHMLPSASLKLNPSRFDACFFAGEGFIASVAYEGFVVDIYCDGETKIYNPETEEWYKCGTDLILGGFDTDNRLNKAVENESLVMDMNSWFDLYCYGEHLDAVTHTLNEALHTAKNYVYQEYFDAETLLEMLDK